MLESKRQNNFDAVRLFLAVTVMLAHMMAILPADYGPLKLFTGFLDGSRAVECFFVISGFLIFRSYRSSRSLLSYAKKRTRRIYPALIAVVLVCALLGMVITEISSAAYLSMQTLKYVLFNLAFMTFAQPDLPGVFAHNAERYVNGPLWTLKVEVMFYAAVPFFCAFSRRFVRFDTLSVIVYAASVAFWTVMQHFAIGSSHARMFDQVAHQLPGQLSFFMAGALLEYRFEDFRRHSTPIVVAAVSVLFAYSFVNIYVLYPAALAVLVIYFCLLLPVSVPAAKYGDFSYGLYIVHFPIIQTFAALAILGDAPLLRALAVIGACIVAAALSWHLVEKWWLTSPGRRSLAADVSTADSHRTSGLGDTGPRADSVLLIDAIDARETLPAPRRPA